MSKVIPAVRVANRAVNTLLAIQPTEQVLIIADHAGMQENGEIIHAMLGLSTEVGADPSLLVIPDVADGEQTLPSSAKALMKQTDVLIGITKTTAASAIHHELPNRLQAEGRLRRLYMVKRSFEALTSQNVLDAQYESMVGLGSAIRTLGEESTEISIESKTGSRLTASIEGAVWNNNDFAHEAGTYTGISWGEANVGPLVGSASGTVVIDGPILGHGWPDSPVELLCQDGEVTAIEGDTPVVSELQRTIDAETNAENIAEIGFGLNQFASLQETNIWKKGKGRVHIAIGDGAHYGQSVHSPIHIDMVLNEPTVRFDGQPVIIDGSYTELVDNK